MSIEEIKLRLQNFKEGKPNWIQADKDFTRNAPDDITCLLEQNQRLVEALEKFADESNWMGRNKRDMEWTHGIIEWDGDMNPIRLANEALQAYKLLEKKD